MQKTFLCLGEDVTSISLKTKITYDRERERMREEERERKSEKASLQNASVLMFYPKELSMDRILVLTRF